jgi:hypothetical protein
MQTINVLAGATALSLFCSTVTIRYGFKRGVAAAALLGATYVFWYESVDAGSYALASLSVAWLLFETFRVDKPRPIRLGLLQGFAIAVHGMMVGVLPAYFVLIWKRRSLKMAAVSSLVALGVALVAYAGIMGLFYRGSVHGALEWVFGPPAAAPGMSMLNNPMWRFDLLPNVRSFWRAWAVCFWGPHQLNFISGLNALFLLINGVVGVLLVRYFYRSGSKRLDGIFFLLWIGGQCVIQFFYAPGIERFRLLYLPVVLLLVMELRPPWKLLASVAGVLLVFNLTHTFWPQRSEANSPSIVRSKWVGNHLEERDFFLFAGTGPNSIMNVYMAYFAPYTSARSLYGYVFSNPGGSLSGLDDYYRQTVSQGGRFYIEGAVFDAENQRFFEEQGRLPAGTIAQWLAQFRATAEQSLNTYRIVPVEFRRN